MSQHKIAIAALVVALGAVGLTVLWRPQASSQPRRAAPQPAGGGPVEEPPPTGDDWRDEMEWRVANLVRRLDVLEKARGAVPGGGASATPGGGADPRAVESLRDDVDALLTGQALETPRGRERMKEVFKSLQEEVAAERMQERMAAREQRLAERFDRFVSDAKLTANQEQQLRAALDAEAKLRQSFLESRDGGARPPFEDMRAARQKTRETAKAVLSEEQLESFTAMRSEERGGLGGLGGGGPGGGGGRRPGGGGGGGGR